MILKTYFDYDYNGGQKDSSAAKSSGSGISDATFMVVIIAILCLVVITLVLTIINMVNINKMKKELAILVSRLAIWKILQRKDP